MRAYLHLRLVQGQSGGYARNIKSPGSRDATGQTTSFAYDINNTLPLLALETSTAGTSRRYTWGDGLLLSMNTSGNDYYVAHDAQGSVAALTSSTGATEDTYTYDPFGNSLAESTTKGAPTIPLRYDAEYLDPTGLYHLGARQMDPTIGAFVTTDPRTPNPTQPAISPYLYTDDQPNVLRDPTGEYSEGGYGDGGVQAAVNAGWAQYDFYGNLISAVDPFSSFEGAGLPDEVSGPLDLVSSGYTIYQSGQALNQYENQTSTDYSEL